MSRGMSTHGRAWEGMDMHGDAWTCMETRGHAWRGMETHIHAGFLGEKQGDSGGGGKRMPGAECLHACPCVSMHVHASPCMSMRLHACTCREMCGHASLLFPPRIALFSPQKVMHMAYTQCVHGVCMAYTCVSMVSGGKQGDPGGNTAHPPQEARVTRGAERPSSAVATTRRGAQLARDSAAARRSLQIDGGASPRRQGGCSAFRALDTTIRRTGRKAQSYAQGLVATLALRCLFEDDVRFEVSGQFDSAQGYQGAIQLSII